MKILILQLARLGDIYLTWPTSRALRRQYPEAEIHYLTRPRFAGALIGLEEVNHIIEFPTQHILEPFITSLDNSDIPVAYKRMSEVLAELKNHSYDWIINYTFSPFSSYLVHNLCQDRPSEKIKVSGYTRFQDGFLSIPDDISAYFYAQVGPQRPNRFHLAEIFASMAGLDLLPSDWSSPKTSDWSFSRSEFENLPQEYLVLHVGASEKNKALSPNKWITIINQFKKLKKIPIVLIGAESEKALAEAITSSVSESQLFNFVGMTDFKDLFLLIKGARLLIGCDSAPIHIASLTQTPCLNISLKSVNFWETGPRAPQSYVFYVHNEEDILSDEMAQIIFKWFEGKTQSTPNLIALKPQSETFGEPVYFCETDSLTQFRWNLTRAIYQGHHFPESIHPEFAEGLNKLLDINTLMLEQLDQIKKGVDLEKLASFLDRGEEVIEAIGQLVPDLGVLIRWYQTEKTRIAPGQQNEILERTIEIHEKLQNVLNIYNESKAQANLGRSIL